MPLETLQNIFNIVPFLFFWGIFLLSAAFYLNRNAGGARFAKRVKTLFWSVLGFRVFYALSLTLAQYFVWAGSPLTRVFLDSGIDKDNPAAEYLQRFPFFFGKFGYFLFYSYGRFWLNAIIVFLCAFAFLWFLKALRKWKDRFFEDGEIELGALSAALSGWPGFVSFLPIAFFSVAIVSVFRLLFMREKLTTLGAPFLLAVLILLLFGEWILAVTGLSVLKI